MADTSNGSERSAHPHRPSAEEAFLRKLCEHYYGVFVIRLFDGVIHNLNGPLQSLFIRQEQVEQNLSQLRDALESEELDKAEELGARMAQRAQAISKNLDDLNAQLRRLSGDYIIEKHSETGEVHVNEVIHSCMFVLNANMVFKHQVTKTLNLDESLPSVTGRRTDLAVIVLNLVENAVEAMADAEEKNLVIETAAGNDEVLIKVHDTGCGIPEQHAREIYRSFFTTKKATEGREESRGRAGLGLSIVSLLVRDFQGRIACDSRPGKTTFTVHIPRHRRP